MIDRQDFPARPVRRAALALLGAGFALWATACVEPPYRNEVTVSGQGGAVSLHHEPKPPEPPPPPPPAAPPPVVIYLPATAPVAATTAPSGDAAPTDAAERQRRIEQLESHMREENAEIERLKTQGPTTAP